MVISRTSEDMTANPHKGGLNHCEKNEELLIFS
jgi:hypothetical protein